MSVVGKLLYFARHLYRTKEITQRELANLKGTPFSDLDLIFSDNEELMLAYQDYLNEGTELTLKSSLIHLIHRESRICSILRG